MLGVSVVTMPFKYVGPEEIRAAAVGARGGFALVSKDALCRWLDASASDLIAEGGWFTYVVALDGTLLLAPRRTEHVACAGGSSVLAAGEIRFSQFAQVIEVTNLSTGYCPSEDCWHAVRQALDSLGVFHPKEFTFSAVFRRCSNCDHRNLVKEGWFFCAICDAALPRNWNFDP